MPVGPGILAADALEANGLTLPELSRPLQEQISSGSLSEASTRNPVDLIASEGPVSSNMPPRCFSNPVRWMQ